MYKKGQLSKHEKPAIVVMRQKFHKNSRKLKNEKYKQTDHTHNPNMHLAHASLQMNLSPRLKQMREVQQEATYL